MASIYGKEIKTEAEFPAQSTHQVKLEDTAKGIRISVHVYATGADEAVTEAFRLYSMCQTEAEKRGIQLAPIEIIKKEVKDNA